MVNMKKSGRRNGKKRVVLVDNYDSFTYNLSQAFEILGAEVEVFRNDSISVEELEGLFFTHLAISPGPGVPSSSGIVLPLIRRFKGKVPILGVCLGHQAIGESFGARLTRAPRPVHGKVSLIYHDGKGVYRGLKNPFQATRYHSLALERESVPPSLEISAESEEGVVMGVRHRELPIEGVQFHPESILTSEGMSLMENFLAMEVN